MNPYYYYGSNRMIRPFLLIDKQKRKLSIHELVVDFWLANVTKLDDQNRFIVATSFSGGESRSTRREPPNMGKQLVNFITCGCKSSAAFFLIYIMCEDQTKQTINSKQMHKYIYLLINGLNIIFLIDKSNMS
jgi:hypothetical protein